MPRPRRGCAGVAASSLRERGQSTRHSPKQSPSLPRACLKIAAWAQLGAVGEAALFFFFGGYSKNPHSHRCLQCPSLPWRECTHGCFSPLVPVGISRPSQQRNQGRAPPGHPPAALRPPGASHGAGGSTEVTNCRVSAPGRESERLGRMEKTFPPVGGKSKISPRVETVKIWLWIREKWDKVGGKGGMEVKKEWRGIRRVEGEDGGTERE